jgi:Glycosyltransferase family 87
VGRVASLIALLVFLAASAAGLVAARHEAPLAIPAARAVAVGARDPEVARAVVDATSSKVLRLDDRSVSVTWFRGGRELATVVVGRDGRTGHAETFRARGNAPGAPLAGRPVVLAALALLFLLATLRAPLRSVRTLDVCALAAFLVPAVLEDEGRIAAMQLSGAVLLAYILVRALVVALRGPADDGAAPVLLERLAARVRAPSLPALLGGALLLATVMVTLTSTGVIDVGTADMEGATALSHGLLPYGHLPGDVVHGDTYGLPIYLVHLPFALLWPVGSAWDEQTGALVVAALALLACVTGIARALGDPAAARWPAVLALLALPAALTATSSGTNDGLIAAALIWALAWWARPALSSAVLAAAGVAKVAPLVLLPLWLARLRGRALAQALVAVAAVGAATLLALVALGGLHGPADMVHAMTFQLSRESAKSLWTVLDVPALQPLVAAATLAIALGGAVLVARDRALAADPRRVAALLTAVLAGLQLQANHWAPLYLLWLAPPALAALLGPLGAPAPARARAAAAVPATA